MEPKNAFDDEPNPFEKLLGDSPELRIVHELLPLMGRKNVDNDETWLSFDEIEESTGVSEEEFVVALAKFTRFKMILTRVQKCPLVQFNEYALDKNSPAVQSIIDFDNILINVIIDEMLLEEELNNFQGNPT